jgi:hypothetical protein
VRRAARDQRGEALDFRLAADDVGLWFGHRDTRSQIAF